MKKQRAMWQRSFELKFRRRYYQEIGGPQGQRIGRGFQYRAEETRSIQEGIQQNLAAQANILQALTEINARYVGTRKCVTEIVNARNEMVGSLVASFYAHEDLLHKAAKGLEFTTNWIQTFTSS